MIRLPIARRCWPYPAAACCAALAAFWIHWIPGCILSVPALLLINFFRDPERKTPDLQPDIVIAPADGKVISVEPSHHDDCPAHTRISIFMNIFDVHVNRVPVSGTLRSLYHYPGSFLNADHREAPDRNERMELRLLTGSGPVLVSLIAGLIARRIVCWARPDDILLRGQRFAMIKLGSRVDIHLPSSCSILVQPGDRVKAGLTPVARFRNADQTGSEAIRS